ncbi:sigma-70 family RNA polymerase sigma factor [Labilibaculum sp. A4]|uniref:Sigma-70 family RNA polymerase sigma factor n=1 Tax=Labilibaculum euxinus TaxID=2686357 RepID=A0A425YAM6_9BACT|nr:sigma-70 family RNA polymerase sigma factor [Labilibaculum euxinus]MDQ1771382.1 sigma-70 family RNA polymerase sigma factor [Labilibaculum euxinus]MUP39280.1 sigma-70 family RNA polymerase sigma factor [Labilibaculum euxinus]MVB08485.1 sigma-70 family RNA polymerase sigma factor [Labilibaculum euxinus]MWN77170.1 sigma-70 family RNA polymerase sigma factor [Labilibaculum euxinus]
MEINPNLSEKAQYDYRLVLSAINGTQKAYEELFKRYKDAIFFMLLKMVNNKNDAEDLTFEAFGKAFRNIKQYSPKYAFSTWLFKIASNNCIDFLRKKKGNTISIDGKDDSENERSISLESNTLNPEQEFIRDQKARIMRNEVGRLKERYRRLIELRYFEEFSYEEIAKELNLPIGTVKAQLFRARELLFNTLKDTEIKIDKKKN